jgi:hypothetical protein
MSDEIKRRLDEEKRLLIEIRAELNNLDAIRNAVWFRGIVVAFAFFGGFFGGWVLRGLL